jgi:riboflavin kinase / FMN adenylyltransferase
MSDWRLVSGDADWSAIDEILQAHRSPCAVTMGTFDGVHAGHRSLVAATRRLALNQGLEVVAVTFSPRPERYFARGAVLPDLCSIDERISRLRAAGADRVVVLPFGRTLAEVPATRFAGALVDELGLKLLCVGEDFACGRDREGDPAFLRALGLVVHVHSFLRDEQGMKISSSRLREQLSVAASPAPVGASVRLPVDA